MNVVQCWFQVLLVMTECLLLEVARPTRNRRTWHRQAVTSRPARDSDCACTVTDTDCDRPTAGNLSDGSNSPYQVVTWRGYGPCSDRHVR